MKSLKNTAIMILIGCSVANLVPGGPLLASASSEKPGLAIVAANATVVQLASVPATLLLLLDDQSQLTGLFFSEYLEGSGSNKALEIYNGTGSVIDLSGGNFEIQIYLNGSATVGVTIPLSGTIGIDDVHVIADDDASPDIMAAADQTSSASFFNGNDAIALVGFGVTLDVIGQIGFDPGSGWEADSLSTANQTLRRKGTVVQGDSDGTNVFDPSLEWDGFAQDAFDGLGVHTP